MLVIYIAVQMLTCAIEIVTTGSDGTQDDKKICPRLNESCGLWKANARAISFSEED
jgi:hypothetical protein